MERYEQERRAPGQTPGYRDLTEHERTVRRKGGYGVSPSPEELGSEGYRGWGPKGYRRSDERIFEDVCDSLMSHDWIDASDIEVHVEQGEVTLTGTVDSRGSKRLADDLAHHVAGVRDVHNRLRIEPRARETGSFSQ